MPPLAHHGVHHLDFGVHPKKRVTIAGGYRMDSPPGIAGNQTATQISVVSAKPPRHVQHEHDAIVSIDHHYRQNNGGLIMVGGGGQVSETDYKKAKLSRSASHVTHFNSSKSEFNPFETHSNVLNLNHHQKSYTCDARDLFIKQSSDGSDFANNLLQSKSTSSESNNSTQAGCGSQVAVGVGGSSLSLSEMSSKGCSMASPNQNNNQVKGKPASSAMNLPLNHSSSSSHPPLVSTSSGSSLAAAAVVGGSSGASTPALKSYLPVRSTYLTGSSSSLATSPGLLSSPSFHPNPTGSSSAASYAARIAEQRARAEETAKDMNM